MIEDDEARRKSVKLRRFALRVQRLIEKIDRRSTILGKIVRAMLAFALWDFAHNVSNTVLGILAIMFVVTGALSIEGWTKGRELEMMLVGIFGMGLVAWADHRRHKDLLLLYRIMHKGRTEWKGMVFDIRVRYIRELHETLDALYPEVELYARYYGRNLTDEETPRVTLRHHRKLNWENRAGARIKSICYEWSTHDKEFKVEYRRTPAQVYATRILQTKGFSEEEHVTLRTEVKENEWRIKPKVSWIPKLGIGTIGLLVYLFTSLILWGGPTAIIEEETLREFSHRGPDLLRVILAQSGLLLGIVVVLVCLRAYVFPAGVFRIDEEVKSQERRESIHSWIFWSSLLAVGALLVQLAANFLSDVCSHNETGTTMDAANGLVQYIKGTSLCDILDAASY